VPTAAPLLRQSGTGTSSAGLFTPSGLETPSRRVPVIVEQEQSGSINKTARGAAGFLIYVKPLAQWLLVSTATDVRHLSPRCKFVSPPPGAVKSVLCWRRKRPLGNAASP
jgi:hypothetical protein